MKKIDKLSIIIPAYNEKKTVCKILEKIKSTVLIHSIDKKVIAINDSSIDSTEKEINSFLKIYSKLNWHYIAHTKKQGKGATLRIGIAIATGQYIILQNAGLEYESKEYNLLSLEPVITNRADVVYGSQFAGNNPYRALFFWHSIEKKLLTSMSSMCSNLNLTNTKTCYKLIDAKILQSIELKENSFEFEPEITAKIAKIENVRVYKADISYYGRAYKENKKINCREGIIVIYCIVRYNLFWQRLHQVKQ